jgi:enterochelin esterase-like enzyme
MKDALLLFAVFLACAGNGFSQNASAALVSPEVHADRTVTFRIAAPKASEVTFKGDWHDDTKRMEKGPDGIWSITVGPLAPSTYIYGFTVDGVAIADPVNPRIKLRARTSGSLVEVPAAAPSLQEPRDVPHGAVEINWQKSSVLGGETRAIWIYTPPGYTEETSRRYPVVYLLHGNNDRPAGWVDVGNLNFIADNLIAERRMVPMVMVMPFGHALPYGERGQPPRTNTTVFEAYLLQDVMPFAERKYRIAAGRELHAVAGMSMGAEQSLEIFFNHLDRFGSAGAMSPAGFRAIETDHAALLADPKGTNAKIDVLWIGCGRQDPGHFSGSQQLVDVLAAHQIRHTWRPTDGMHNYALWRDQLVEFLPLLFQPATAQAQRM